MCDLGRVTRERLSYLSLTLTLRRGRCPALKKIPKTPSMNWFPHQFDDEIQLRGCTETIATRCRTVVGIVSFIDNFVKSLINCDVYIPRPVWGFDIGLLINQVFPKKVLFVQRFSVIRVAFGSDSLDYGVSLRNPKLTLSISIS